MRRGLEIFLLAFVFRAQSFIVSPGNPLVSLLRVDILNIMGPSIVVAASPLSASAIMLTPGSFALGPVLP